MSGFMFGGSALTLDVGVVNATGAAVTEGMILAIELDDAVTAANNDGLRAQLPVLTAANPEMVVTVHGAALVPTGASVADGDNLIVRVVGPCKVRVDANAQNVAIGDMLYTVNGSSDLVTGSSQPDLITAPAVSDDPTGRAARVASTVSLQIALRSKAVAREAATTDNALINAWMKGLPL
jgi:hypothetical protein